MTDRSGGRPPSMGLYQWGGLLMFLLTAMLATFLPPCDAMYEDQVGMWDWYQKYIGRVTHAAFLTQGSGRKRVVVATDKNVIASLHLRKGEIFWRRLLGESDSISAIDIVHGKYAVTLSGGNTLRSWHLPDGTLVWETVFKSGVGRSHMLVLPIDLNGDKMNDIIVSIDGAVSAISSVDGSIIWTSEISSEDISTMAIHFFGDERKIFLAGVSSSSALTSFTINVLNGESQKLDVKGEQHELSTSGLLFVDDILVALSLGGDCVLTGQILSDATMILERVDIPGITFGPEVQILPAKIDKAVILSTSAYTYIIEVKNSKELVLGLKCEKSGVISNSLSLSDTKSAIAIVEQVLSEEHTKISVRVVSTDTWDDVAKDVIDLEAGRGWVQRAFLNSYIRTDRSHGFRVLIVSQDDSLALLQQGEIVWTREDGLASIIDTSVAELPLEKAGVSVAEVEHGLAEWIKGHILKLKSSLMLANADDLATLQALRLNNAEKTRMTRDHNGFRKLILVLTKVGKLLALHTGDGHIVWSILIPAFQGSSGTLPVAQKILPYQIPHQHALDENPVFLIMGKSENGNGILVWVDAQTGKEVGSTKLSFPTKLAIPLPFTDSFEQRLHILIDNENNVHLFPVTEESLRRFSDELENVFFYVVDKLKGMLHGYKVDKHRKFDLEREGEGYIFSSTGLWSVVFPTESEVIAVTASRSNEVVHTQAKVLGNRDVMYKYLNKNMVFVATVAPQLSNATGGILDETWLVAYLIDTITGQVLHRVTHPNAQGPVHAVFSENWVVYHYFNVRSHRYQMSVLEIYDRARADGKSLLQLMLKRHNSTAPFTSFSYPDIEVKEQTYYFPATVKTMTVTNTARGITGKQILLGTVFDQVIALDKRFLDPRRSLNPTPAEREEGILPLTEGLPILPQSYISHFYRVQGISGIQTIPARLESTCLVFAHGVDLFYTQIAPSRTYDSLTEDFSYALLLITIFALVIAIAVSYVLSERKELSLKWR